MIIPPTAYSRDWGPRYYARWTSIFDDYGDGQRHDGPLANESARDGADEIDRRKGHEVRWPMVHHQDEEKDHETRAECRERSGRVAESKDREEDQDVYIPTRTKRQLMLDLDEPTSTRRARTTAAVASTTADPTASRRPTATDAELEDTAPAATRSTVRVKATATAGTVDAADMEDDAPVTGGSGRSSATSRATTPGSTAEADTEDSSAGGSAPSSGGRSKTTLTITDPSPSSPSSSSASTLVASDPEATPTNSSNILSQGVASTNLQWWQLLCIALVSLLAIGVGGYMYWKQRKKKQDDKKRREEVEREEKEDKAREVALAEVAKAAAGGLSIGKGKEQDAGSGAKGKAQGRKETRWSDDDEDEDSEDYSDYDSMSDGGTIRPRRRYRSARRGYGGDPYRNRDRDRDRRRRGGGGRRGYGGYSDDYYSSDDSYGQGRRRGDRARERDRSGRHPYETPLSSSYRSRGAPPSSSSRPPGDLTSDAYPYASQSKPANFRDSVFSTFSAMKSAAIKLKRHEAEARLEQQLAQEEAVEQKRLAARRGKVREANEEIERERVREVVARELEREKQRLGMGSGQSQLQLQSQSAERGMRSGGGGVNGNGNANHPTATPKHQGPSNLPLPSSRQPRTGTGTGTMHPSSSSHPPLPQPSRGPGRGTTPTGAHGHGHGQFRTPTSRSTPLRSHPRHTPRATRTGGSDSHSQTQTVEINQPRDRPTIPRGMLQPAPPPKARRNHGQGKRQEGGGSAARKEVSPYTGVVTAHTARAGIRETDGRAEGIGGNGSRGGEGVSESHPGQTQGAQQQQQQQQAGGWGSTLAGWWSGTGKNAQSQGDSQSHAQASKTVGSRGEEDIPKQADGFEIPLPPASARAPPHEQGSGGSTIPPVRSRTLAPAQQRSANRPGQGRQRELGQGQGQGQGRGQSVLESLIPAYGGLEIPPARPAAAAHYALAGSQLRQPQRAGTEGHVVGAGIGQLTGYGSTTSKYDLQQQQQQHPMPTAGLGLSMPIVPGSGAGTGSGSASGSARGHRGGWEAGAQGGPRGVGGDLKTAATGGRAGIGAGGGKWADRLRARG